MTSPAPGASAVRVRLPAHLRTLAECGREVQVDVADEVSARSILDALEARYPVLRGTIRDQVTGERRPYVRFFVAEDDVSHDPADAPLPLAVATGEEPFNVIGAMAGG